MTRDEREISLDRKRLLVENHNLRVKAGTLQLKNTELKEKFSLYSVMHPLPSKEEMTLELNTMLKELNKDVKPSYLKRSVLKGVEIGFKKCYDYVTGNCA
jgi:hypothetical protein